MTTTAGTAAPPTAAGPASLDLVSDCRSLLHMKRLSRALSTHAPRAARVSYAKANGLDKLACPIDAKPCGVNPTRWPDAHVVTFACELGYNLTDPWYYQGPDDLTPPADVLCFDGKRVVSVKGVAVSYLPPDHPAKGRPGTHSHDARHTRDMVHVVCVWKANRYVGAGKPLDTLPAYMSTNLRKLSAQELDDLAKESPAIAAVRAQITPLAALAALQAPQTRTQALQAAGLTPEAAAVVVANEQDKAKPAPKAQQGSKVEPIDPALAIDLMARINASIDAGQAPTDAELSLRRLVTWEACSQELQGAGLSAKTAMDLAFRTVTTWALTDEDGKTLVGLYQAKTARNPVVTDPVKALERLNEQVASTLGETVHPYIGLVVTLAKTGIPLWLWGPSGAGKSVLAEQALRYLGRTFDRVQGSKLATADDMLESIGASVVDGATETKPVKGALARAWAEGRACITDEFSTWSPELWTELHAVLEGNPLRLRLSGEVVPFGGLVVTENTLGLGEDASYVGTQAVNHATRNRFAFVKIPAMPDGMLAQAFKSEQARVAKLRAARQGGAA